jgi:haloalkane dehalogenase
LRVVEAGPERGAPVVLVHGWGINAYLWRRTIPALVAAGHRVHALDLPGHGLSDKPLAPGSYSLPAMVAHVRAAIAALGLSRPLPLVAQSMGGRIVLEVALRHPEIVRSLALFGSVGIGDTTAFAWIANRLPAPRQPLTALLSQRWIVALGKAYSYGRRRSIETPDVDAYWAATQFPEFVPALHRALTEFDWRPLPASVLAQVTVPALVVFGTRDRMVRARRVMERVSALPQGRLHLVRDAGHVANEEADEEVNPLLVEFIRTTA